MMDLFNEKTEAPISPDMLMQGSPDQPMDLSDYVCRVERFELGGQDTGDESGSLERLLTRIVRGDGMLLIDRKDSISATTGMYTCVVIYMEQTLREDSSNA